MQMQFAVEKRGIKFEFKFTELDEVGRMKFDYKCDQFNRKSNCETGWFHDGICNLQKGTINFKIHKIGNAKCAGVSLPESQKLEIQKLVEERKNDELVLIVKEYKIDPDGLFTKQILVPVAKFVRMEDRKRLDELKKSFGSTIKGDCLAEGMEIGETYTLQEIEEMVGEEDEDEAKGEAKRIGQPVEIVRFTTTCNDPRKECDLDIIRRLAMPNGSVTTQRTHCY